MKFDNIGKEYNYILNLFQQNSIMIKDIIINQSIILTFIQNGKMREIILLYNNESKSITHYELNFEFKNLMSDIAQIKKDVHDIHNAIYNNNINISKNNNNSDKKNIFDYNTKEFDMYHNFVIDNTLTVLNKQITNQENYLNELEKKTNEYQESARNLIKKGDKENCKKLLVKKKRCVERMKFVEGLLGLIEEQKLNLENTKAMHEVFNEIKKGIKAIQEASKGYSISELEAMKEEIDNVKEEQEELKNFFNEHLEEEDNKKNEEKKEDIKEDKNEDQKEEKKEKQSLEDNEENQFEQYKEEGNNALKVGVLSIIFANEGISSEGLKRIQEQLDNIKKIHEEYNNFFKNYIDESEEKEA